MHLSGLKLYNFRNLTHQTVAFAPGVNFVIGNNGQGKTNLVEAVSLLSIARSFRTSNVRELVAHGETSASAFGTVTRASGSLALGIVIEESGRHAFINGERVPSVTELLGKCLSVTFAPGDLSIIKGGPSERRRFLDRHMSEHEPTIFRKLMEYTRALRSKNELLRSKQATPEMLASWNGVIAPLAAFISNRRRAFIAELMPGLREHHQNLTGAAQELSLVLESNIAPAGEEVTVESVFEALSRNVQREIRTGMAALGPHRDDMRVTLEGSDTRSFASQGQARTLVLALKLSVIDLLKGRHGDTPLVVLDDVDSELDPNRRGRLYELLAAYQPQIFVTATAIAQEDRMRFPDPHVLEVKSGMVSKAGA